MMKILFATRWLLAAMLIACSLPTLAGLDEGDAAYKKHDYATALKEWRSLTENADAQNNIGAMYHNGEGVKQDYAEAMNWYRKAAALGNAEAEFNIGAMYYNGEGVKQDYAEAMNWYRKAAALGNADAQFNIGVMYYKGEGIKQDYAEAMNWYRKAAALGNAAAQNALNAKPADSPMVVAAKERQNHFCIKLDQIYSYAIEAFQRGARPEEVRDTFIRFFLKGEKIFTIDDLNSAINNIYFDNPAMFMNVDPAAAGNSVFMACMNPQPAFQRLK